MSQKYTIVVKEVLARTVNVNAANAEQALETVESMYRKEKVVLDASDYRGTYIFITNKGDVTWDENEHSYEQSIIINA